MQKRRASRMKHSVKRLYADARAHAHQRPCTPLTLTRLAVGFGEEGPLSRVRIHPKDFGCRLPYVQPGADARSGSPAAACAALSMFIFRPAHRRRRYTLLMRNIADAARFVNRRYSPFRRFSRRMPCLRGHFLFQNEGLARMSIGYISSLPSSITAIIVRRENGEKMV